MTRHELNKQATLRRALVGVVPVMADDPPAPLHLADNTNLFGIPPTALQMILGTRAEEAVQYPQSSGPQLREAVAAYLGVQPNEVVIGCGADDVIDCAFRAFCEPGDRVAFPDPTFVMARYFAITNGLTPKPVPVCPGGAADIAALVDTRASVLYVCAPNNPTGLQPSKGELRSLLNEADGIVMLDEAYADFSGESLASEVAQHGRAIIIRTFSKAFGLAGLRVGYAVGAPALMLEIEKTRGPFPVSSVSLRAATAAISDDLPWVRARVADAIAAREELLTLLRERGLAPLPSAGNFVFLPVADSHRIAKRLGEQGISVRTFTRLTEFGDAVRITVGPLDAMRRVADALKEASA